MIGHWLGQYLGQWLGAGDSTSYVGSGGAECNGSARTAFTSAGFVGLYVDAGGDERRKKNARKAPVKVAAPRKPKVAPKTPVVVPVPPVEIDYGWSWEYVANGGAHSGGAAETRFVSPARIKRRRREEEWLLGLSRVA